MPDAKLTALTALSTPSDSDVFYVVADIGTTPASKKTDRGAIKRSFDGWIPVTDSWTYATANTITVPAGATSIYQKGMKLRLKQGGAYKYFYITIVASTLLTVTAGTDYTVANAAITDIAISASSNPLGFPNTFACAAPTWDTATVDNGTGGQQPTGATTYFSITGNEVHLRTVFGATGATKNGNTQICSTTAMPATLPNQAETTLQTTGICAVVVSTVGLVGYTNANGQVISCVFQSSIADNATLGYLGFNLTYKY